ncbi:O-antigen ligase family protein [Endothiovibrio diazotrophicus]
MHPPHLLFLLLLALATSSLMLLGKGNGGHLIALDQEVKWGALLLFGAPLCALATFLLWRRGWRLPPRWALTASAVVVVAWLLSSLFAFDPGHSLFAGYRLYLIPLGLMLLAAASRPSARQLLWLFGGLALLALLFALVGLAQHFSWNGWLTGLPRVGAGSLLYSQNFAGEWLVLLLPAVVAFGVWLRPGWPRRLYAAAALLILAHLVLTEGRAAWVALLLGFAVAGGSALYLGWRRRTVDAAPSVAQATGVRGEAGWWVPGAAFLAVAPLFLLLIATSPYWSVAAWWRAPLAFETSDARYLDELGSIRADRSSGRLELWRDSLALLRHETGLLGAGVEHYRLLYPKYMDQSRFLFRRYWEKRSFRTAKYAHNDYIQLIADLGVPGMLAVMGLALGGVGVGLRRAARTADPEERLVMVTLTASVMIYGIVMFFDFPSRIAPTSMTVWFFLGLLLARADSSAEGGRWLPAGLIALFVGGGLLGWTLLAGEYFAARGEIDIRAGRFEQAAGAYRRALQRVPWDERFLTKASWMAARRRRCDEALVLMAQAERRNPLHLPVLLNGLATCPGAEHGEMRSAVDTLIRYYPDIPETRRWIPDLHRRKTTTTGERTP